MYRATTQQGGTAFWGRRADASEAAPVTVVRVVPDVVEVVCDGRVGLMRAADLAKLHSRAGDGTAGGSASSLKALAPALTRAHRRMTTAGAAPAGQAEFPKYDVAAAATPAQRIPRGFTALEEAIAAGFPVPRGAVQEGCLGRYFLAAQSRPHGVRIGVELVRWAAAAGGPSAAAQLPPLLADLPAEVRTAFAAKAAAFLRRSAGEPVPYTALFAAAMGLPPQEAAAAAVGPPRPDDGSAASSPTGAAAGPPPPPPPPPPFQPYGAGEEEEAAASSGRFCPAPVLPQDVQRCLQLLAGGARAVDGLRVSSDTADAGVAPAAGADGGGDASSSPPPPPPLLRKDSLLAAAAEAGRRGTEVSERHGLVFVASTEANVRRLCRALQLPRPLLLEGDTGVGKTVSVFAAAERLVKEAVRFNLSSGTTAQDLVGRLQICGGALSLSEQPFARAFGEGLLLVLDECNLAQEEVLATLETALDTGVLVVPDPANPARSVREIRRHPGFRLVVTQNPCTGLFAGKRHRLSPAFLSRFRAVSLDPLATSELATICAQSMRRHGAPFGERACARVAAAFAAVHGAVQAHVGCSGPSCVRTALTVFTCRDVLNAARLAARWRGGRSEAGAAAGAAAWCVYAVRFLSAEAQEDVWRRAVLPALAEHFAEPQRPDADAVALLAPAEGAASLPAVGAAVPPVADGPASAPRHAAVVTRRVREVWGLLDAVAGLGRPVLLVGPCGEGTSHAALGYAALRSPAPLQLCHVTEETLVGNLVGQSVPCFGGEEVVRWVDGPVTAAMEAGAWLVLDDLPSASATVLERLNSVLEEVPELFVAERGAGLEKRVVPESGFRVLATATAAQLSALSPAFANRFTVVVMPGMRRGEVPEEMGLFARVLLAGGGDEGSKGKSAVVAGPSDADMNEAAGMCVDAFCKGEYGLHSVVRALLAARRIAEAAGAAAPAASHLRTALLLAEVGGRWLSLNGGEGGTPVPSASAADLLALRQADAGARGGGGGGVSLRAAAIAAVVARAAAPSLDHVAQRVAWCAAVGLPVAVVDDHGWGMPLHLRGCESVVATAQSSIAEWLGSVLPTCTRDGVAVTRVPGPLLRALEGGGTFVIDGLSRLAPAVQAQLSPLLETGRLPRPGEGAAVSAAAGFSVVALVSSARGVSSLLPRLAAKFVVVHLPRPAQADYHSFVESAEDADAAAVAALAAAVAADPSGELPMDVRRFKRAQRRFETLRVADAEAPVAVRWALAYASTVLPACRTAEEARRTALRLAAVLRTCGVSGEGTEEEAEEAFAEVAGGAAVVEEVTPGRVLFRARGLACEVAGKLERHAAAAGGGMPQLLAECVVAVAFANAAGEALVLAGPTACKTLAAGVYCAVVGQELEVLHLTCSTGCGDLVGSTHPMSSAECAEAVARDGEALASRSAAGEAAGTAGWRAQHAAAAERVAKDVGAEATVFSFKDGPLTAAVKAGGSVLLKAADLPDPDLYVSLAELLHEHTLPLSVAATAGYNVPLRRRASVVLTVTCPQSCNVPRALECLPVQRCAAWDDASFAELLAAAVAGGAAVDAAARLVASGVRRVARGEGVRAQLRLARFVEAYAAAADVGKPQALVFGVLLLHHGRVSETELVAAGWTQAAAAEAVAVLPSAEAMALASDEGVRLADCLCDGEPRAGCVRVALPGRGGTTLAVARGTLSAERLRATSVVPTAALLRNLASVFATSSLRLPLLLEGAPGIGKSFLVQAAAGLLGASFVRVHFSAGTTVAHLFGSAMPAIENGVRVFRRREGVLGAALRAAAEAGAGEVWVLLDELNLAAPEVQQALAPLLQPDAAVVTVPGGGRVSVEKVRLFAAVNPAAIGGGRSHLPPTIRSLFAVVQLHDMSCAEALRIARSKFRAELDFGGAEELEEELLSVLAAVHRDVAACVADRTLGCDDAAGGGVNLRTLEKVVLLLAARLGAEAPPAFLLLPSRDGDAATVKAFFLQVLDTAYKWMFAAAADRERVAALVAAAGARLRVAAADSVEARGGGGFVACGEACVLRGPHPFPTPPLPASADLRRKLGALACACGSSLGVLVEGAAAAGKTSLVAELARVCGQRLRVVSVGPGTEVPELLGSWMPWGGLGPDSHALCVSFAEEASLLAARSVAAGEGGAEVREALARHLEVMDRGAWEQTRLVASTLEVCACLEEAGEPVARAAAGRLRTLHKEVSGGTAFHFAEAQLVRSMQEGEWVLLDNVDWAPPAVVERLNSLLEADASFHLIERGEDEEAVRRGSGIHPNFRVFFTSNPSRRHASKLSSAFLNRVVRLALPPLAGPGGVTGGVDTALPSMVLLFVRPDAPGARFWQYVCTEFHQRAVARVSSIGVRTLLVCLEEWRADAALHGATHTALFLLCGVLLRTYSQASPPDAPAFAAALGDVVAEAGVMNGFLPAETAEEEEEEEKSVQQGKGEVPRPKAQQKRRRSEAQEERADGEAEDEEEAAALQQRRKKQQGQCLRTLHARGTLRQKAAGTGTCDELSCGKDSLVGLATELCTMWTDKRHGILEEILANLVAPPGTEVQGVLHQQAQALSATVGLRYPSLSSMHLLCMMLYSMEGPDIDRMLGFEGVPVWDFNSTAADKAEWRAYVAKWSGTRNATIYQEINGRLRAALEGDEKDKIEATLGLKKWTKFVGVLVTLCDTLSAPTVLFRSLARVPEAVLEGIRSMRSGDLVGWPSANSCSKRRFDDFLGTNLKASCRFTIKGVGKGLELEHVSAYKDEEEVLLPPFTLVRVQGVETAPTGTVEVQAELVSVVCFDDPQLLPHVRRFVADADSASRRLDAAAANTVAARRLALAPLVGASDEAFVRGVSDSFYASLDGCDGDADGGEGAARLPDVSATVDTLPDDADTSAAASADAPADASLADAEVWCGRFRAAAAEAVYGRDLEGLRPLTAEAAGAEQAADGVRALLPCNTFTRYEAAAVGVELYIPGLIRAITTNFTYNKVFASKTAGGARAYACAVAVDAACFDGASSAYAGLFSTLRQGLSAADLDAIVLVFRGDVVHCVHTHGEWDALSAYTLALHAQALLRTPEAQRSEDGQEEGGVSAVLRVASALVGQRGGRRVFVLSPSGVPFQTPESAEALRVAEAQGVQVLGLGLGGEIHVLLPRAVSVPSPDRLGHGLARLLHGPFGLPEVQAQEEEGESGFWGRHHEAIRVRGQTATCTRRCSANVFAAETVGPGEGWTWKIWLESKHPVRIGVGCALVKKGGAAGAPKDTLTFVLPQAQDTVSIVLNQAADSQSLEMIFDRVHESITGPLLAEPPQLLVGFTGPGSAAFVGCVQHSVPGGDEPEAEGGLDEARENEPEVEVQSEAEAEPTAQWHRRSETLIVSDTTLTSTVAKYAGALRDPMRAGQHTWEVVFTGGVNGCSAGIATDDVDLDGPPYRKKTTWLVSNHGKASHGDQNFQHKQITPGTVVTCHLDMDARTMAFSIGDSPPEGKLEIEETVDVVYKWVGLYTKDSTGTVAPPRVPGHKASVVSITSHLGSTHVSAGNDKTIRLWRGNKEAYVHSFDFKPVFVSATSSWTDDQAAASTATLPVVLAAFEDGEVQVLHVGKRRDPNVLPRRINHPGVVCVVDWPQRGLLFTGAAAGEEAGVKMWNVQAGTHQNMGEEGVTSLAVNKAKDPTLVAGTRRGSLLSYKISGNFSDPVEAKTYTDDDGGLAILAIPALCLALRFVNKTKQTVAAGGPGGVVVWELTAKPGAQAKVYRQAGTVIAVAFVRRTLVTCNYDGRVVTYEAGTTAKHREFKPDVLYRPPAACAACASNGDVIFGVDCELDVWKAREDMWA